MILVARAQPVLLELLQILGQLVKLAQLVEQAQQVLLEQLPTLAQQDILVRQDVKVLPAQWDNQEILVRKDIKVFQELLQILAQLDPLALPALPLILVLRGLLVILARQGERVLLELQELLV